MTQHTKTCPTCGSYSPRLHPAVQFEGEVQICKDAFHTETATPKRYDFYDFNDIMIGSAMCDFRYIREDDHDRIVAALQTQVDAQTVNIRALTKHGDTLRTQLAQANGWLKHYELSVPEQHKSLREQLAQAQNEALELHNAALERAAQICALEAFPFDENDAAARVMNTCAHMIRALKVPA